MQKYEGEMDVSYTDDVFSVTILIKKMQKYAKILNFYALTCILASVRKAARLTGFRFVFDKPEDTI